MEKRRLFLQLARELASWRIALRGSPARSWNRRSL